MIPKCADFAEIKEAYNIATMILWSKEEAEIYDYWQMRSQDERGAIEYSFLEGERKGKLEGKIEELLEGIGVALEVKYGDEGTALMGRVKDIGIIEALEGFKELLKTSASVGELKVFLGRYGSLPTS